MFGDTGNEGASLFSVEAGRLVRLGRWGWGRVLGRRGLVRGGRGGGRVLRLTLVGHLGHVAAVAVNGVGHLEKKWKKKDV